MKYVLIDIKRGDMFNDEFETKEEAIFSAEKLVAHLTTSEKKNREIYVIESVNPDEDAPDHFDGNEIWRM